MAFPLRSFRRLRKWRSAEAAGSSSLKLALFEGLRVMAKARFERIGTGGDPVPAEHVGEVSVNALLRGKTEIVGDLG